MANDRLMVGKRLKLIAIFMIMLVVSVPFVQALSYGDSDGQTGGDDVSTGENNSSTDGGDSSNDLSDGSDADLVVDCYETISFSLDKNVTGTDERLNCTGVLDGESNPLIWNSQFDGYSGSGWMLTSSGYYDFSVSCSNETNDIYSTTQQIYAGGTFCDDYDPNDDTDTNVNTDTTDEPEINDSNPPAVSISSVKGRTVYGLLDYTGEGSLIEVKFSVSDDVDEPSSITSEIEFAYSDGSTALGTVNCNATSCTGVTSSSVPSAGAVNVIVRATDSAGNEGSATGSINAAKLLTNASNLWTGNVKLSPPAWDREVASFVNQKMYAEITLTDGAQTLYSADFRECISAEGTGVDSAYRGIEYLQNNSYVSSSEDSKKHYFIFTSKKDDVVFDFDGIKLACTFMVDSHSPSTFAPNDEVSVIVTIPFYNNPAGMATNATLDKIEDAKEATEGMWETLDDVYEWIKVLEWICKMYNFIQAILDFVDSVTQIIAVFTQGLEAIPLTTAAAQKIKPENNAANAATGEAQIIWYKNYYRYVGRFCTFVACDYNIFDVLLKHGEGDFLDKINPFVGEGGIGDKVGNSSFGKFFSNSRSVNGETSKMQQAIEGMAEAGVTFWDKDNIVYMALNLCIPGLLKKAHEWRAIQCTYVLCLVDQAESGVMDETICETIKNSQECEYLLKVYNFFPFSGAIEMAYNLFREAYATDTIGQLNLGLIAACEAKSKGWFGLSLGPVMKYACGGYYKLKNLLSSYAKLESILDSKNQYFQVTSDNDKACEDMEDAVDKFKDEQESFKDGDVADSSSSTSSDTTNGDTTTGGTTQ